MKQLNVIDLFAGVGGLSLGFAMEDFRIVYANEFNEEIADSYLKNHPETEVDTRDIGHIEIEETFDKFRGKVNVVIGGPPCQGYSQKGKRSGLSDDRNFMFKYFFEVVSVVKPEFVVIENVPNILTAAGGHFMREILESFKHLDYQVEYRVLKAENFGVPQIRRRAFFLAHRGRLNLDLSLPEGNGNVTAVGEAISDLPRLKSGEGQFMIDYQNNPLSSYQRMMRDSSEAIYNHIATKHSDIALERLALIGKTDSMQNLPQHHQTKSIHSGTWSRIPEFGFARTITTRFDTPSSGQFTLPDQDRCLTVREAARLQSFPDKFIFYGTKTCQMLQVGNAVPPLLGQVLARKIKGLI